MKKKDIKTLHSILKCTELNHIALCDILQSSVNDYEIATKFVTGRYCSEYSTEYNLFHDAEGKFQAYRDEISNLRSIIGKMDEFVIDLKNLIACSDPNVILRHDSKAREYPDIKHAITPIYPERDPLFKEIARDIVSSGIASTSGLQRRYSIGFARSGKIMDQLEAAGIVGPSVGGKMRDILVDPMRLEDILNKY